MSEPALDHENLPFPAGKGPFRVKGSAYRGHIEYVDAMIPGGMPATLERVRDDALRAFFGQSFLPSSSYDVFPLVAMGYVCARLVGQTFPDFLRTRARWQCERDVGGVYRIFLQLASPKLVAARLPSLAGQYFAFGASKVVQSKANEAEGEFEGVPELLAPWLSPILEAYVVRALELNGAHRPRGRIHPFQRGGERHGLAVGTCRLVWSWG